MKMTSHAGILVALLLGASAAVAQSPAPQAAPAAPAAQPVGDPVAGRNKAAMCIGCHGIAGYKTAFPEVYQVPRIGGQNAAYIVSALRSYANGERRHPSMQGVAKSLKEQDMLDLAAYYTAQGSKK
ncbi:MAG TPA: c-type cytochrome [Burkholderiaceae bacterium]|nr:c-type cytochrome [Burkholderiaceae bacterium]